jgi:hypothetical protein
MHKNLDAPSASEKQQVIEYRRDYYSIVLEYLHPVERAIVLPDWVVEAVDPNPFRIEPDCDSLSRGRRQ